MNLQDSRPFVKPAHQIRLFTCFDPMVCFGLNHGSRRGAALVHAYLVLHAELAQYLDSIHSFVHCLGALKDVDLLMPVWIYTFTLLPSTLSRYEDGNCDTFSIGPKPLLCH